MNYTHNPSDPELDDDGTCLSAVDWLGNRFRVGDTVMYCVAAGRGQMMAFGVVRAMKAHRRTRTESRPAEPGETPTHVYLSKVTGQEFRSVHWTVPYHEITVQVLTSRTSGAWNNEQRTRPAWVNPMNITAVAGLEKAVTDG